jgi:hypothetical protein
MKIVRIFSYWEILSKMKDVRNATKTRQIKKEINVNSKNRNTSEAQMKRLNKDQIGMEKEYYSTTVTFL